MEIQIRKADIADIDTLVQWRMTTLHEVFPDSVYDFPENLEEENRAYYLWALPAEAHIACFAYADDEIVGCGGVCLHEEMPSPDNPTGKCAYLMNIYCAPSCRGRGVGGSIVRWLIDRAKERNITKIYLETTEDGRKLYEKLGFTDMQDMMILTDSSE